MLPAHVYIGSSTFPMTEEQKSCPATRGLCR